MSKSWEEKWKPKLVRPELNAISRDTATDVVKYVAYKKKMFIYLRILKLLNIVTGKEKMDPPEFERPTLAEIRDARENRDKFPNRYRKLLRKLRYFEEYEVYTEKRDIAMGILASSLNDEAAIEFLRDENDEDVMEPSELFKNIDDYFLYNTEVIIQNLKNEVKDMKLEKGMSMEALGKKMKVVYYYLHVLGKGEEPDAKKTNLANSILRDPQVDAPRKSLIMQILSADYYDELSFDQMINKIKHIEQYTTKNVASVSKVMKEEEQKTVPVPPLRDAEVSDYERARARDEPVAAANSAESYPKLKSMKFKGRCNKCGGAGHVSTDCPSITVEESRYSRKSRGKDASYDRGEKKQSHKKLKSDKNKSSRRDDDEDTDDCAGYVREYDDGDSVDD
jgi:Zinc knuckle